MVDNPKPDVPWVSYQPTYIRFNPDLGRSELSIGDDVWHYISFEAMVQIENWAVGQFTNWSH